MGEPGELTKLALDAIAKYFFDLCNGMMLDPGMQAAYEKEQHDHPQFQTIEPIFEDFHNLLAETIPVGLANEVTNKLLATLDEWLYENKARSEIKMNTYQMLTRSVIHPLVTRIEPDNQSLRCANICPVNRFDSCLLKKALEKTAQILPNLKALHLGFPYLNVNWNWMKFGYASELEELSGLGCNKEELMAIAYGCKKLKSLSLCHFKAITDDSIDIILNEMDQLVKLNIAHTGISSKGVTHLLSGFIQKGALLKLKCLTISVVNHEIFGLLQKLSFLDVSLYQNYYMYILSGQNSIVSLREIKNPVHEIGNQLVFLELTIQIIKFDDTIPGVDFLEILSIGQYCKKLKCFHISGKVYQYGFPKVEVPLHPPLPGFQTIRCLKMEIESYRKDYSQTRLLNLLNLLVLQCINLKKVRFRVDTCLYSKDSLVRNLLQAGGLKSAEEVYFKPCCRECVLSGQDRVNDEDVVQMLIEHCPNLRIISGVPGVPRNHHFNTQRVKIISYIQ